MKKVLMFFSVSILALFLAVGTASAVPFTNWSVSLDGGETHFNVPNYLTIGGQGYVENELVNENVYNFEEWAVFNTLANNLGTSFQDVFPNSQMTGTLTAEGQIVGQQLSFTSGHLDIYVNSPRVYGDQADDFYGAAAGDHIAHFMLDSGSGFVNADLTPEGSYAAQFTATMLEPGYFFDPYGNDLAMTDPISLLFAVSNVTASYLQPDANNDNWNMFISGLEQFAGLTDPQDNVPLSFFFASTGEFTVGSDVVPVPEPASMFLFGAGLLGLAAFGRKKMMKKD